jgi:MFS family permease
MKHLYITFFFLLLQKGVTGMISWSALAFITLYFQYQGLTDAEAGIAACFLHIGAMISGPFAGILGDIMSQHYPYHGRLVLAQLSMLFRVPFAVLAFFFLPTFYNTFWIYCSVCFILGTFCVGGVVINRPVLAELVLPSHRATVFSIVGLLFLSFVHTAPYLKKKNVFLDYCIRRVHWFFYRCEFNGSFH